MPLINRVGGGGGSAPEIFNFPLTISPNTPTADDAKAVGHLWVIHDTPADFSNVVLDDAVKVSYTNGYLMLIVDDTNNGSDDISQPKKLTTGEKLTFSSHRDTANDTTLPWQVGSLDKSGNVFDLKRKYPIVYSRLNDVLDIETAYVWDGSEWIMISQQGHYLFLGATAGLITYNQTETTLNLHDPLSYLQTVRVDDISVSDDNSDIFFTINKSSIVAEYIRSGNVFAKTAFNVLSISGVSITEIESCQVSHDGIFLAVGGTYNSTTPVLLIFKKQEDGSWAFIANLASQLPFKAVYGVAWSHDDNQLCVTGDYSPYITRFKRDENTFTKLNAPTTLVSGTCLRCTFSPNDSFVFATTVDAKKIVGYHIVSDTQWDLISAPTTIPATILEQYSGLIVTSDYVIVPSAYNSGSCVLLFYTYSSEGLVYRSSSAIVPYAMSLTLSMDGTKLAVGGYSTTGSLDFHWFDYDGETGLTELIPPEGLSPSAFWSIAFIG